MNVSREPYIGKVVLSAGAVGPDLEKARKLLVLITGGNAQIIKAGPKRRIPELGVKPGLELGTRITLRGNEAMMILQRTLGAINNTLKKSQVRPNHFSFGIKEYIEMPGMEYVREIGIRGFNVSVVFERNGTRVADKKIKRGRIPKKQHISV